MHRLMSVCMYVCVCSLLLGTQTRKHRKSDLVQIIHTIRILRCHCTREAQTHTPKFLFLCPPYMRVCICGAQTTAEHANTKKSKVKSRPNNTHNTPTTMPLYTRSSNTGTKVPLSVPCIHACMYMWRSDYSWARKHANIKVRSRQNNTHNTHTTMPLCTRGTNTGTKVPLAVPSIHACLYMWSAEHANTQKSKVKSSPNNTHNTHTTMPLCTRSSNIGTKVPLSVPLIHACMYMWSSDYANTKKSKVRSRQNNTHKTHTTMPLYTRSTNTGTKVPLSVPCIHACMSMWSSDYC